MKENHKEFLTVKGTMLSLEKLTRFLYVQIMIKKCNQLIR